MTVLEGLPYALFVFAMVFMVLACLWLLIRLFSLGIMFFEKHFKKPQEPIAVTEPFVVNNKNDMISTGELKLHNVDERTAAMIMAIVSDESGIPLSELCFRSIKAVEKVNNQ